MYRLTVTASDGGGLTSFAEAPVTVNIAPKPLNEKNVEIPNQVFSGKGLAPDIIITDGDYRLVFGKDYITNPPESTEYSGMGAYPFTVTFIGNYTGLADVQFRIVQGKQAFPLWLIILIASAGALLAGGILWGTLAYRNYKLKKYGMKRHIKSFLDNFDSDND
jgi:hypothetical protein